jgi:hypothetical protein
MAKQHSPSSPTPQRSDDETAEVFSVSQEEDGSLHFSRKDFIALGLAVGGGLLVKGLCPRFGTGTTSPDSQPVQAGLAPALKVYVHAKPRIDSNILETLKQKDIVRLIADHPDLDWVEVGTQAGRQGWLKRDNLDFSRPLLQPPAGLFEAEAAGENAVYLPIISNSPAPAPTPTPTEIPCPSDSGCPTHQLCPGNMVCPPVESCPIYTPCTCDAYPCNCVADICTCVAHYCSCDVLPCACDTYNPCSCNAYPCGCVTYNPCSCVADFCPIT